MYQSFFGLAEPPFSIAPDPRYLYMSARHQEALAHLLYGLSGEGGFVLLTGEVGTGKTTVCRCLLEQIPEACDVAYIFNPRLTVAELLSTICKEFGIHFPGGNQSIKVFVDCINEYLLAAHARGRHTVLIIDEAQNLATDVLEQMRLLTNLETNQKKLLQIILIGQPELGEMLARAELRQLAQRIVARYHLGPLEKHEISDYLRHRLEVSGAKQQLIPAALSGTLYRLSGGVPRVLNVLCERALLGAYTEGKERVDRATLAKAAREVLGRPSRQTRGALRGALASVILLASGALAMAFYQEEYGSGAYSPPSAPPPAAKKHAPGALLPAASKQASPVPEAPLPARLESDEPINRSGDLAYGALFRAWGLDYSGGDPCQRAEQSKLRCHSARAGLDELRRLNRPAVLQMRDPGGREFFAALTALDDTSATFVLGDKTRRVARSALASQWSGVYTMLWRAPEEVRNVITPGARGLPVVWLGQQLARIRGREPEKARSALFDDALVREVKQFQLEQGLIPDGTVGPQTLMQLSSVVDASAPVLLRTPGAR